MRPNLMRSIFIVAQTDNGVLFTGNPAKPPCNTYRYATELIEGSQTDDFTGQLVAGAFAPAAD